MRTSRLVTGVVALALMAPLGVLAQSVTFGTAMSGQNEFPLGSGSADGSGVAAITVNGTTIQFAILVKGITTPTLAHIHKAAAGASGGVVFDFHAPVFTNGYATGSTTGSASDVADLLEHPELYYVNVHTVEFPAGALRGQLGPNPQPTANFVTALTGAGEAPATGDANGGGVALITVSGTNVTFTILVQGLPTPPILAHIHRGLLGSSGGVVVNFVTAGGPVAFSNGIATGTTTISAALAAEILSNPAGFYVNVHTTEHPGGALRGVLNATTPTVTYFPTVVKTSGLNGTQFVTDLRIVNPTQTAADVTVDFFPLQASGTGSAATTHVSVAAGAQAVINDAMGTLFGLSGAGSFKVSSNVPVVATSRVLNDQRPVNGGTNGLLVFANDVTQAPINGTLPLLSQASGSDQAAGIGFRTNIGYFNPTSSTVTAKFTAKRNDGTTIGSTVTVPIPGFARVQLGAFDLISTVTGNDRTQSDFYVAYSADGPLFVYSTLVDNKTGDGIYGTGVNPR